MPRATLGSDLAGQGDGGSQRRGADFVGQDAAERGVLFQCCPVAIKGVVEPHQLLVRRLAQWVGGDKALRACQGLLQVAVELGDQAFQRCQVELA